jgi:hypothetical protein
MTRRSVALPLGKHEFSRLTFAGSASVTVKQNGRVLPMVDRTVRFSPVAGELVIENNGPGEVDCKIAPELQ